MIFWGEGSPFWPPKIKPRPLPITPISYFRILVYYKNVGVCRMLELNILKIYCTRAILSSKKCETFFDFEKFFLAKEN